MSQLLSGKPVAEAIRAEVGEIVKQLFSRNVVPTLALIVATHDEAALSYVRMICKTAAKVGVQTKISELDPTVTEQEIEAELQRLAADPEIHGIILQTPLPEQADQDALRALIPFSKDVDGASPLSAGRLVSELDGFAPATAAAVMQILHHYNISLQGKQAVVIGRSRVVGKPVATLLLHADATVTVCHSKTEDLADITKEADIVVAAVGKPKLITIDHIKTGAIVIDVGTNILEDGTLVGDVDAEALAAKDASVSPVPGGVGPVTTAILLHHTVRAAKNSLNA
jgi:methylenetetrahydrofolate dehydrogenase (NADP+)/methenyltetrahydrofolate cyclohydrolase